jgi:hypothetical protein
VTFHAKRRDICEKAIVVALRAAGATVQSLDAKGVPDLLVGFQGRTYLLECKDSHNKPGIGMKKTASGLRDSQLEWWSKWAGAVPVIVTNENEALRAIGAGQ